MPRPRRRLPEDFHALYDMGFRAARRTMPRALQGNNTAGHRRLSAVVPDVQVNYDDATHLPNRVSCRTPTAPLSRSLRRRQTRQPGRSSRNGATYGR